jgi:hypothetical protein
MVLWRDVEPARSIKVNGRTPGIRYFVAFLFEGGAAPRQIASGSGSGSTPRGFWPQIAPQS